MRHRPEESFIDTSDGYPEVERNARRHSPAQGDCGRICRTMPDIRQSYLVAEGDDKFVASTATMPGSKEPHVFLEESKLRRRVGLAPISGIRSADSRWPKMPRCRVANRMLSRRTHPIHRISRRQKSVRRVGTFTHDTLRTLGFPRWLLTFFIPGLSTLTSQTPNIPRIC